jgi:S-DNA-T family DNA segregation ATPase FtsK/SpoIIIE
MNFDKKSASKPAPKRKPKQPAARPSQPAQPLLTADQWIDLFGYCLIALAAATILSVLTPNPSPFFSGWVKILQQTFGWGMVVAPVIMLLIGVYLLLRRFGDRFPQIPAGRVVGITLAYLNALATLQAIGQASVTDAKALVEQGGGGGYVGKGILDLLVGAVGNAGAVIVLLVLWVLAFMLITGLSAAQIVDALQRSIAERRERLALAAQEQEEAQAQGVIVPPYDHSHSGDDLVINGLKPRRAARKPVPEPADEPDEDTDLPPARPITQQRPLLINQNGHKHTEAAASLRPPVQTGSRRLPPPRIIGGNEPLPNMNTAGAAAAARMAQPPADEPDITSRFETQRQWVLPAVDQILDPGNDAALKEADIRKRAQLIEETLNAFGVPGRVVEVNRGPTITQFGVEPGFIEMKGGKQVKVKVSRIAGLADDLALALSAPRIRIEAPVPGRAIVGIEVPNGETSLVSLRDVMESDEFGALIKKTPLRLGLGQDVSGHPVVADMTTMPHLLIAGTTGSGKSVCVNAIIAALLCYNSPEDLRLLMVDPKRVELTGYNGIPHLISPVVVDLEKVTGVLIWVTREMENRYRTFAKHGARNIVDFNRKVTEFTGPARPNDLKKLPYIVVVIDELADLMMLAPDETEKTICRLAQMARATGIHLIIATQRPSVDVVTGLIKANFPARIAFTVATSVDSRVILDTPGAEKLLGRGDMLVVTPEQPLPVRSQGCFVSDKEINRIVRHWRAQVGGDPSTGSGPWHDPITASMTAPSIPMTGTLNGEVHAVPTGEANGAGGPLTWDEARALTGAAEVDSNGNKDDKLYQDAVATVRLQGKASISLLQRRLRIGYTRAARLIEQMEERGVVGPNVAGSQFREVLKMTDDSNQEE